MMFISSFLHFSVFLKLSWSGRSSFVVAPETQFLLQFFDAYCTPLMICNVIVTSWSEMLAQLSCDVLLQILCSIFSACHLARALDPSNQPPKKTVLAGRRRSVGGFSSLFLGSSLDVLFGLSGRERKKKKKKKKSNEWREIDREKKKRRGGLSDRWWLRKKAGLGMGRAVRHRDEEEGREEKQKEKKTERVPPVISSHTLVSCAAPSWTQGAHHTSYLHRFHTSSSPRGQTSWQHFHLLLISCPATPPYAVAFVRLYLYGAKTQVSSRRPSRQTDTHPQLHPSDIPPSDTTIRSVEEGGRWNQPSN